MKATKKIEREREKEKIYELNHNNSQLINQNSQNKTYNITKKNFINLLLCYIKKLLYILNISIVM